MPGARGDGRDSLAADRALGTAANGGTATNDATAVTAIGASQSPSDAPSDSPSPSPQASSAAPATAQPRVGTPIPGSAFLAYTVRAGDTLSRIANSFGLSVTTLYWANSINVPDPQLVKIGQIMKIPPMDGLAIAVQPGATIQSIADKYGIDPQELIDANDLSDTTLVAGELLLVPGAGHSAPAGQAGHRACAELAGQAALAGV